MLAPHEREKKGERRPKRERGKVVMKGIGQELERKSCVHLIPIHELVYGHLLSKL